MYDLADNNRAPGFAHIEDVQDAALKAGRPADDQLRRFYLKDRTGDIVNVILLAVGYNFRRVIGL
jgi:hypothetical protein